MNARMAPLAAAAVLTLGLWGVAAAQDTGVTGSVAPPSHGATYCRSVADAVADARYARQVAALTELEDKLSARIAELEEKRAEFEAWVSRREEMLRQADESVVAIYSQMRPDAASEQIAIMAPEAAAAILSKIDPRTASTILNEMQPETAAYLTNVMSGRSGQDRG